MGECDNVTEAMCKERMLRLSEKIDRFNMISEDIKNLTLAVQELTLRIGQMAEVQKEQDQRLAAIEERDGDMWRTVVRYAVTAVVGIVIGLMTKNIGF